MQDKDPNLLKDVTRDGVRHLVFDNDVAFAPNHVQAVGREGARVEVGGGVCESRAQLRGDGEEEQIERKNELKVGAGGSGARGGGEGSWKGSAGGGGQTDARLQRIARILQLGF